MKSNNLTYLLTISFMIISFTSHANFEICKPDKNTSPLLNFIWIGSDLFRDANNQDKVNNLKNFCVNSAKDPTRNIILWSDREAEIVDKELITSVCTNLEFKNIQELFKRHPVSKLGYKFLFDKRHFSAGADLLKLLVLNKYGGCYFDLGTNTMRNFSVDLLNIAFNKNKKGKQIFVQEGRLFTSKGGSVNFAADYDSSLIYPFGTPAHDGTAFYNMNFMAAPLKSQVVNQVIKKFEENIMSVLKNPFLQIYFERGQEDSRGALYNAGAIFNLAGPVAFSGVLAHVGNKLGIVKVEGIEYKGGTTWSNRKEVEASAKKSQIFSLGFFACAKDYGFIKPDRVSNVYTKCRLNNLEISSHACLFQEILKTSPVSEYAENKNNYYDKVSEFSDELNKIAHKKCEALETKFKQDRKSIKNLYTKQSTSDPVEQMLSLDCSSAHRSSSQLVPGENNSFKIICACEYGIFDDIPVYSSAKFILKETIYKSCTWPIDLTYSKF